MWLPGHLALAFVIALPLILLSQERSRVLVMAQVAVFSVFPDFFHIGDVRMISHSLIGLGVLVAAALLFLSLFNRQSLALILGAIIGASVHLLGDAYIGHIYPFFPLSDSIFELHRFNTLFDLQTELLLSGVALVLFLGVVRPWREWGIHPIDRKGEIQLLLLAAPFAILSAGELALYALSDVHFGAPLSTWLLIPFFLLPLLASGFAAVVIMLRMLKRA